MINQLSYTAEKHSTYELLTLLDTVGKAFDKDTRTVKVAVDAFRRYEKWDENGNCIVPAQFYTVDVEIAPAPIRGWFVRMTPEDYTMMTEAVSEYRLRTEWAKEVLVDMRPIAGDNMLILYAVKVADVDTVQNFLVTQEEINHERYN